MSRILLVWVLVFAGVVSAPADAQRVRADSVQHRNDCRLAHQVLTHGQPANKREWALGQILTCGAAGGAAIAEVIRLHPDHHTKRADLEAVVMLTSVFRDSAIFNAAMEVASDPTAGKASRIQSIRILYFQVSSRGHSDSYESFLADERMIYVPLSDHGMIEARPLPADAVQRAIRAAEAISASTPDDDLDAAAGKLLAEARAEIRRAAPPR